MTLNSSNLNNNIPSEYLNFCIVKDLELAKFLFFTLGQNVEVHNIPEEVR